MSGSEPVVGPRARRRPGDVVLGACRPHQAAARPRSRSSLSTFDLLVGWWSWSATAGSPPSTARSGSRGRSTAAGTTRLVHPWELGAMGWPTMSSSVSCHWSGVSRLSPCVTKKPSASTPMIRWITSMPLAVPSGTSNTTASPTLGSGAVAHDHDVTEVVGRFHRVTRHDHESCVPAECGRPEEHHQGDQRQREQTRQQAAES